MQLDPKKEQQKRCCKNCVYWREGDPCVQNINCVGVCTVLMTQTTGFYDKNPGTPYWAQGLIHRTTDFDGTSCLTFVCKHAPEEVTHPDNPYRAV